MEAVIRRIGWDVALAAALVALALADAFAAQPPDARGQVAEVIEVSSVAVRRVSAPLAAAVFLAGALTEAAPPNVPTGEAGVVAILVLLYSLGRHAGPGWPNLSMALLVGAIIILEGPPEGETLTSWLSDLVLVTLTSAGAYLVGMMVRRRSEREREFAQSSALQQDAWVRRQDELVEEERRRIARELHDVVGHALAGISVTAGAASQAPDNPPEVDEALRLILESSRQASEDMRRLVGLLRTAADVDDRAPAPTLAAVDALVERARATGLEVRLTMDGPSADVAPGLQLVMYRIVQEGLTNAMRHGAGHAVDVGVHWERGRVRVEVADRGARGQEGQPPGHGLTGLRERVLLYGGEFAAGPDDRGFTVSAVLPLS